MFPNWSGWKTVKLILSAVGAGAAGIAAAHISDVVTQIATVTGTVDGSLLAVVVLLSGTALGPSLVKP